MRQDLDAGRCERYPIRVRWSLVTRYVELHKRQYHIQAKTGLVGSMIIHNSFRLRRITTWMRLKKPAFRVSRIWNNVQPLVRSSEVWGTPVNQEGCELDFDAVHGIMEKECGHYATKNMKLEHISSSVFWLTSYRFLALLTVTQILKTSAGWSAVNKTPFSTTSCSSQVMSSQVKAKSCQNKSTANGSSRFRSSATEVCPTFWGRPSCSTSSR